MDNKLADLIPQYGKLNGIYKAIAEGKRLSFENLKFIADFHKLYGNSEETERAIIDLMCGLEKDDTRFSKLLDRLREEIGNNLSLYEANKEAFDGIDTYNIVREHVEACNQDIELQEEITREKYRQLMEAEGSLESMAYREHTDQELELAVNRREHSSQIYQREKAKLDKLYEKRKLTEKDAIPYMEKRFDSIRDTGNGIISIINNYALKEAQGNAAETKKEKKTIYFNNETVYAVYDSCVGHEFEKITRKDFFANLNLLPCDNELRIRQKQKIRVYYIIYSLKELVHRELREQWMGGFLKKLGLNPNTCNSKYKDAVKEPLGPGRYDFKRRVSTFINRAQRSN